MKWYQLPGHLPARLDPLIIEVALMELELRLEPQKNWEVNNPSKLNKVVTELEKIQKPLIKTQKENQFRCQI